LPTTPRGTIGELKSHWRGPFESMEAEIKDAGGQATTGRVTTAHVAGIGDSLRDLSAVECCGLPTPVRPVSIHNDDLETPAAPLERVVRSRDRQASAR
jgi:hypothetical protein